MTRLVTSVFALVVGLGGVAVADVLCIRVGGKARVIRVRAGEVCRPTEVRIGTLDGITLTLGVALKVESDVTVDGGNLHVRNGSGQTELAGNGKGNVIIGYNEDPGGERDRSGSHNLVIGQGNEYTSYGGIVSGSGNSITAEHASVIASVGSDAGAHRALVVGGSHSTALGEYAVVVGGFSNTASALVSTIVGGEFNLASSPTTSMLGGRFNSATRVLATAVGGACNAAGSPADPTCSAGSPCSSGACQTVTGGFRNSATGGLATVSGGQSRSAPGLHNWAAGSLFEDF